MFLNRLPRSARTRLLGLAVLAAAVGGAWLGIVKPDPFAYRQVVHVMFDHVQSIAQVQRNVRVAGVNVGTIGAVRRVGVHAEVDLVLDQRISIYRNATAALRPHTPFEGTAFVDLNPGTPGAGLLGNAPIPLSHTSVFVSAGDVLSTFTAPVRHAFQAIVGQLSIALGPAGSHGLSTALGNAPALLRQTASVAPALRGPHEDELRRLIPALSSTIDALAGRGAQLQSAIHDARQTLDAVATGAAGSFEAALDELPGTLASIADASGQLRTVIRTGDSTSDALIPTLQAIPPTTAPFAALLERARPTLRAVPPVIRAFAVTLARLGSSAPALERLFATLGPGAAKLRGELVPYLDSRDSLGLPVYLQLLAAGTGFTGVLSSFLTKAQSPLVTGHSLRGELQAPVTLPTGISSPIPCSAIAVLSASAVATAKDLGLCST